MNAMSTGGILPQTGPFVNAFCRKKSRKMKKFPISIGKIFAFQKLKHLSRVNAAPYCDKEPQNRPVGERFF